MEGIRVSKHLFHCCTDDVAGVTVHIGIGNKSAYVWPRRLVMKSTPERCKL